MKFDPLTVDILYIEDTGWSLYVNMEITGEVSLIQV